MTEQNILVPTSLVRRALRFVVLERYDPGLATALSELLPQSLPLFDPWEKTVPDNVRFGPDIDADLREFAGDGSFQNVLGER